MTRRPMTFYVHDLPNGTRVVSAWGGEDQAGRIEIPVRDLHRELLRRGVSARASAEVARAFGFDPNGDAPGVSK